MPSLEVITLRYLNAAVALSHWGWKEEESFQTPPAMCGLDNPEPPRRVWEGRLLSVPA